MAATFSAFDRSIHKELIPYHLKDTLTVPSNVLHHLRKGNFSVCLLPTEWHGVALDECHEMQISKDAKLAVIHPSKHKMKFLSYYMSFCTASVGSNGRRPQKSVVKTWVLLNLFSLLKRGQCFCSVL